MNALITQLSLLAAGNGSRPFENGIAHHYSGLHSSTALQLITLAVCAVVGLWLASRWLSQSNQDRAYDNPMALFRSLCQAHGLLTKERSLLRQLAAHCRLSRPAEIFLRPDCFVTENLPADLRSHRDQLSSLQKRLFANY